MYPAKDKLSSALNPLKTLMNRVFSSLNDRGILELNP